MLERTIYPATVHEAALAALRREPGAGTTIAFIGRVTSEKGPQLALQALNALIRDYSIDADLEFCGPLAPGIEAELAGMARALGVSNRVRTLGAVDAPSLSRAFARANVVIVPSVWEEPFGLVCLEAALARVPVVVARTGGLTEILAEEEHALFFPTGDVPAAAAAIARVLSEPGTTASRVSRAYTRAREFSIARYLKESESFVHEAYDTLTVERDGDAGYRRGSVRR